MAAAGIRVRLTYEEATMIHCGRGDAPTVQVTFELPAAVGAKHVTLCGDFNDWSETATPLTRLDDGRFRVVLHLEAGRRWHFRYLVDGERWENDWAADDYEHNIYGGMDSVVDLRPSHRRDGADERS